MIRDRHTDQWDSVEEPENIPSHVDTCAIRRRELFSINGAGEMDFHMNLDPDLAPYTKVNLRHLTDPDVKGKNAKLSRRKHRTLSSQP